MKRAMLSTAIAALLPMGSVSAMPYSGAYAAGAYRPAEGKSTANLLAPDYSALPKAALNAD